MRKTPSTELVENPAPAAEGDQSPSVVPNAGASVTLTPAKWAEVYFPASSTGRINDDLWKHDVAAQMHGWAHYFARTGKPVELTAADYEAAVAAVSSKDSTPHAAADYRSKN